MSKKSGLLAFFGLTFFLFAVSLFVPHFVQAATFNVSDASSLQSALDTAAANNQDNTINLSTGTYNGGSSGFSYNSTSGHALTLNGQSQNDTFLTSSPATLVVDTNGPLTVQNLTIKNSGDVGLLTEGSPGTNTNSFVLNVHNVSFINNASQGMNVAFYNGDQGGSVTVTDSTFDGNGGSGFNNDGGGFVVPVTFSRNVFVNNSGHSIFAHRTVDGSNMEFDRNYFANNSTSWGAGLAALADCLCTITATSNVIVNNTGNGTVAGIGVVLESQTSDAGGATLVNFINNTVVHNIEADSQAGGLLGNLNTPNAVYNFYNNIFWDNAIHGGGDNGSDVFLSPTTNYGSINFLNNDVHSILVDGDLTNYHSSNNIDADPLFQGGNGVTYFQTVAGNSPALGAGNSGAPALPSLDFAGIALHSPPDMGAFALLLPVTLSAPSAPICGASAPATAPNLFQLHSKGNSVTLYFAPDSGQNTGYYIGYGFDSSAQNFGTTFNYTNGGGVVAYTIHDLYPGIWYFKVRGQNGCMPGAWSGVMKVQVSKSGIHTSM